MNPLHQRPFRESDLLALQTVGNALVRTVDRVLLPMGGSHFQGMSNRCAAAAVSNGLETCVDKGWLDAAIPPAEIIYREARRLDGQPDHAAGTVLEAAAEAACRLMDGEAKWMVLPRIPEVLQAWLAVERTAIAYGTVWTTGHMSPTWGRVLVPTREEFGPGHAITLNGFLRAHEFRPWLFGKKVTRPVFTVENTHQFSEKRFYLPFASVPVHGLSAVVFVPPAQ